MIYFEFCKIFASRKKIYVIFDMLKHVDNKQHVGNIALILIHKVLAIKHNVL